MDLIKHPDLANIKASVVGIEPLRKQLRISKKQMSELLKVDPASLSRWSKDSDKIPSYIWNALFLLKTQYSSSTQIDKSLVNQVEASQAEVVAMVDRLQNECIRLKNELAQKDQISLGWKSLLIINTMLIFYYLIDKFF